VMPPSACAAAKFEDDTPDRNVTMYSPGIASPICRSSIDTGTEVDVVEEVLDDVVEDVVGDVVLEDELLLAGATVVVVGSSVSITDMVESASTISTCGSCFSRRTSALSSDATKPFTFEAKTSLTSFPSDDSLFTFAATLTVSFKMTMWSRSPPVVLAGCSALEALVVARAAAGATGARAATSGAQRKRARARRRPTMT